VHHGKNCALMSQMGPIASCVRAMAIHNAPPAYAEVRKRSSIRPPPDTSLGRMARTKQVAQVADVKATQSYRTGDPFAVSAVDLGGS